MLFLYDENKKSAMFMTDFRKDLCGEMQNRFAKETHNLFVVSPKGTRVT